MLKCALFLCSWLVALSHGESYEFADFVEEHQKEYESIHEYFERKDIFEENRHHIDLHNAHGAASYKLKMNKYADMSWAEFKNKMVGPSRGYGLIGETRHPVCQLPDKKLPSSFDWVVGGAVTPVKDQGHCGSCWAFSTTGALEGLNYLVTDELISFSEQQLVSCDPIDAGCKGGLMENSFSYVARKGICLESDFPYTSGNGSRGQCKECDYAFHIDGYSSVPARNETALQLAVYQQPVSIALEADKASFQFYSEGVMDSTQCGQDLDHAVLVVGWGTLDGKAYWKVKNSWSKDWGVDGYILLARNIGDSAGQCGLALEPSYPVTNTEACIFPIEKEEA